MIETVLASACCEALTAKERLEVRVYLIQQTFQMVDSEFQRRMGIKSTLVDGMATRGRRRLQQMVEGGQLRIEHWKPFVRTVAPFYDLDDFDDEDD